MEILCWLLLFCKENIDWMESTWVQEHLQEQVAGAATGQAVMDGFCISWLQVPTAFQTAPTPGMDSNVW